MKSGVSMASGGGEYVGLGGTVVEDPGRLQGPLSN